MTNSDPIDDISIGGEVIRLGQFLKFAGLLDSGGDAKEVIIDGYVTVNGEIDRRRGRQLRDGDLVSFEGRTVASARDRLTPRQPPLTQASHPFEHLLDQDAHADDVMAMPAIRVTTELARGRVRSSRRASRPTVV